MPRNPFKWVQVDVLEMQRPLNPAICGFEGTVSLAPRYEGRGWHNPAKWEAIITAQAGEQTVEIRHSFEVVTIETNDENIWRKCWLRARASIDYIHNNGELKLMINAQLHAVPTVIVGEGQDVNSLLFGE
jgi:hypothetical protein